MTSPHEAGPEAADAALEARRRFLATCGKFAIATPPAVTLILSQSGRSYATAMSGGHGGGGWGGGHSHGRGKGRGKGKGRGHSGGHSGGHNGGRGRGRGHS